MCPVAPYVYVVPWVAIASAACAHIPYMHVHPHKGRRWPFTTVDAPDSHWATATCMQPRALCSPPCTTRLSYETSRPPRGHGGRRVHVASAGGSAPCAGHLLATESPLVDRVRTKRHVLPGVWEKNGSKMGRDAPRGGQQAACHTLMSCVTAGLSPAG